MTPRLLSSHLTRWAKHLGYPKLRSWDHENLVFPGKKSNQPAKVGTTNPLFPGPVQALASCFPFEFNRSKRRRWFGTLSPSLFSKTFCSGDG